MLQLGNTVLFTTIMVILVDIVMLRFRLRREIARRFPDEPTKGITLYAVDPLAADEVPADAQAAGQDRREAARDLSMSHRTPCPRPTAVRPPTCPYASRGPTTPTSIAGVQVRAWPELYAGLLPAELLPTDVEAVAAQWRQALAKPADARHRVLVALERNRVVGFALTSPAVDPDCDPVADGELAEVTLDPRERAKGHGSRLLQAAVDTLAADRFTRAVTLGQRRATTPCAPSSPTPAGRPTPRTASSTSTAPARPP